MNRLEFLDQEWGDQFTQLIMKAYRWGYTLDEIEDLIQNRMKKTYRIAEEVHLTN